MAKLDTLVESPIKPVYWQETANEVLDFGTFEFKVKRGESETDRVKADVSLRFVPDDRVEITSPTVDWESVFSSFNNSQNENCVFTTPAGAEIDVFLQSTSERGVTYVPRQSPFQTHPPTNEITKATFHLLNWPDFSGPESYVLQSGTGPHFGLKTCGRFAIPFDGWIVTIAGTGSTDAQVRSLKEQGGYAVTHAGSIVREDGNPFSTEELDEVLTCLRYFFAFVLGRWNAPELCVGFGADDSRVFEQWGLGRAKSGAWRGSASWFDLRHAELMRQVFPGFRALWMNELWRKPLTEAIYWYVGANQVGNGLGVDSAILHSQAALELLAWTHCVQHRKMVSEKAFKLRGLSAAGKMRLLASSLEIPLEIPFALTALNSRPGKKWDDGMHAITDLRNGLVHPGSVRNIPDGAYYDGWRLSLWYIDLVLLRLCGHTGNYANRLAKRWVGQVERVPWAIE